MGLNPSVKHTITQSPTGGVSMHACRRHAPCYFLLKFLMAACGRQGGGPLWGTPAAKVRSSGSTQSPRQERAVSELVPCCRAGQPSRPNTTDTADPHPGTLRLHWFFALLIAGIVSLVVAIHLNGLGEANSLQKDRISGRWQTLQSAC